MISIPCKSAMSVICKVKIPLQITYYISPKRNYSRANWHLCDLGLFIVFFCFFCIFHAFFLPFSKLRIMEAVLGIINESLDSFWVQIQEAHQKSEISKDDKMDYMHGSMRYRTFFYCSTGSLIIILKISISNNCAAPTRAPVGLIRGIMSVNSS